MQYTKILNVFILTGVLAFSHSSLAVVPFTGGPVIDGTNIKQNVIQNIEMIERHLRQAADWKSLQKIVKQRIKNELSSAGASDLAKEKNKQDTATALRNHQIASEMAPVKISGCGDGSSANGVIKEYEAILIALFRDANLCNDESSAKIAQRSGEDDRLDISVYNKNQVDGTLPLEQAEKDKEFIEKIKNSVSQVQQNVSDLNERAKQNASGSTLDAVAKAKIGIENAQTLQETINITQIEGSSGEKQPDLMTQSLAYLNSDTFSTLTPDTYDEALDVLIYMMGANEKIVASEKVTDKNKVLDASENIRRAFPYRAVVSQFNDRMQRGNSPSKLEEYTKMARFYEADKLAPRIAGSDTIVYQVQREALVAKSFKAVVEVERFKKMLDNERMLAVMLAEKVK